MIITYQGLDSFKISQGNLGISINPKAKTAADVTLFTAPAEALAKEGRPVSEKSGFVITGPGEYEIKDIFVKGFLTKEKEIYKTTYLVTFEGMKLCFLSSLERPKEIENVDILFVPVDADPAAAYKAAVSLEPSVMIPMDCDAKSLAQFVKESGEKADPVDKFVVKKKDLEGKESEIVILKEE